MIIACLSCKAALRVLETSEEARYLVGPGSESWPDKFVCYRCESCAHGFLDPEIEPEALAALDVVDVSAQEAYAALSGLGLPEERTCTDEVIRALLGDHGIKVRGRQERGALRFYIDCLELSDGTRLYFAPSPSGAVIYRIVKPHSYAEKVLSEHPEATP